MVYLISNIFVNGSFNIKYNFFLCGEKPIFFSLSRSRGPDIRPSSGPSRFDGPKVLLDSVTDDLGRARHGVKALFVTRDKQKHNLRLILWN